MKKITVFAFAAVCALSSSTIYAAENWKGEFYNIIPTHSGVTEDFCKQHALDTYDATAKTVDKEVTGQNGVKAKDLGYKTTEQDGVFLNTGTAEFSGTYEGKPWREKVRYWGLTLKKDGGMEQGAWATKDCKGFYRVGPNQS